MLTNPISSCCYLYLALPTLHHYANSLSATRTLREQLMCYTHATRTVYAQWAFTQTFNSHASLSILNYPVTVA
ncbi:MAG: hypothetical protein F6K26_11895 [Moorea sp. SIO2I5]|nr:hypothetical protein [Moorena sp. SIO2I5]